MSENKAKGKITIDKEKGINVFKKLIENDNSELSDKYFRAPFDKVAVIYKGHVVELRKNELFYDGITIPLKKKEYKNLLQTFFEKKQQSNNESLSRFNNICNELDI